MSRRCYCSFDQHTRTDTQTVASIRAEKSERYAVAVLTGAAVDG